MSAGPRSPTDAELDEMFERSKNDYSIWVGSDIRILVGEIKRLRASASSPDPATTGPLAAEAREVVAADRASVGRRTLRLDLALGRLSLALLRLDDATSSPPPAPPATTPSRGI